MAFQKERLQRFTRIAADLAGNEDSLTLLAMLVDEFYQSLYSSLINLLFISKQVNGL